MQILILARQLSTDRYTQFGLRGNVQCAQERLEYPLLCPPLKRLCANIAPEQAQAVRPQFTQLANYRDRFTQRKHLEPIFCQQLAGDLEGSAGRGLRWNKATQRVDARVDEPRTAVRQARCGNGFHTVPYRIAKFPCVGFCRQ